MHAPSYNMPLLQEVQIDVSPLHVIQLPVHSTHYPYEVEVVVKPGSH